MKNIGFIGLGEMGLPMSINLKRAGFQVHAFDVNASSCREGEKEGVIIYSSPKEVAMKADEAIICMVRNLKQTEDVIFGLDGVVASGKHGKVIIIMSTLDPASITVLAERLLSNGYDLVDAPVSGAKSGAEAGTLTIMTAGKKEIVQRCDNYFKAMGKNIYYFGNKIGSGQAAKLANNLILAINMVGFTEGMKFAQEYELPTSTFRDLITVSTGNSWVAQNWDAVKMWWEHYSPNTTLDIVYKDLLAIQKDCAERHFALPLGGLAFHLVMHAWTKNAE
ncbi:MAG: NAD(P)-dependent oxidoreductase [Desulfitobacteriaceae bacterium]|nr:NAD(P)-dependent oxidoreductase [Desulfitobacteriaceae bacterium]